MGATPRYTARPLQARPARLAAHLARRGRHFHYRRKVPADLRHLLPREITRSLGTPSVLLARKRARRIDDQVSALFVLVRRPGVTPQEADRLIAKLVDEYVREMVEDDRRQQHREGDPLDAATGLEIAGSEVTDSLVEGRVWDSFDKDAAEALDRAGVVDGELRARLAHELAAANARACYMLAEERRRLLRGQARLPLSQFLTGAVDAARSGLTDPPSAAPGMTVGEAIERYVQESSRRWSTAHAKNVATYLHSLEYHLGPSRTLASVTKQDIVAWRDGLREGERSDPTVRRYIKHATSLFAFAVASEWIDRNPAEQLPGGNGGRDRRRPDEQREPVSDNDLALIVGSSAFASLRGAEPRDRELFWAILLLAYTGARRGEVAQALVEDIKQDEGVWFLRIEECEEAEKEKRIKSAAARRSIPLHPDLIALGLLDYLGAARETGRQRLFPQIAGRGGDPLTRTWQKLRDDAHASPQAQLAGLRPRFATQLKYAGVAEVVLSELLGHAVPSLSMGRYASRFQVPALAADVKKLRNREALATLFNQR